jgi:hypothetical protein
VNEGQLVVGYHGCDITTRDDLVAGRTAPQLSHNRYDWLGAGFYLFENDRERAEIFARTAAAAPERRLHCSTTPATARHSSNCRESGWRIPNREGA